MAELEYPITASDFSTLEAQGLTVEYAETDSNEIAPPGGDWDFWSWRTVVGEKKAVWRRIVSEDEVT